MHAWTTSGNPVEHPDPWGLHGAFTTLRKLAGNQFIFLEEHLARIINSAKSLGLPWVPPEEELRSRLDEFIQSPDCQNDQLVRICLFEEILAISARPVNSDGNPVEGWLLNYRRPDPSVKCTAEKDLYGSLRELEVEKEDWVIHDPKDNDLRETATSNLIFAEGSELLIPEKRILQGITLQKLLPVLTNEFSVTRGIPDDQNVSQFDEILLCGTGRGLAPLSALSELGWSSRGSETFSRIRLLYDDMIHTHRARV